MPFTDRDKRILNRLLNAGFDMIGAAAQMRCDVSDIISWRNEERERPTRPTSVARLRMQDPGFYDEFHESKFENEANRAAEMWQKSMRFARWDTRRRPGEG